MTKPAETPPAPNPDIDEHLHGLWQKYGQMVVYACGLILLFYVGRAGWGYISSEKESSIRQAFSAAKTPEQLKAFVSDHPDHPLAAVADVEIGDQAYAAGQMDTAISSYREAILHLKGDPLEARARIGLAMAQIAAGQAPEGEAALRALLDDPGQIAVVRVEAGYQLANLAATAGRQADVQKLALQMMQIDPNSPWTQKAFTLSSSTASAIFPGAAGK